MEPLMQVKNISKAFSGVPALSDISIDFYPGRVHVLLGENGAGKSTLIKIIAGIYQKDQGEMRLGGIPVSPKTPREGIDLGISVIHQELSVIADLTVAENIFLDKFPRTGRVFVDFRLLKKKTAALMERLHITNISPMAKVRDLCVADRQMVEIMRSVSRDAKVVIMDEPTSSLSEREVASLFSVVKSLKEENVVVVYISHKLSEISLIGDDISILKDGRLVCTKLVSDLSEQDMIRYMVGREIGDYYVRAALPKETTPVLEVKKLTGKAFRDVSFTLHKGEVLGFAGLIGAGRTEVMRAIFGADAYSSGTILLNGKEMRFLHPQKAIRQGIGLIPEDRRHQGVLLDTSVEKNVSIVSLKTHAKRGFVNKSWEREIANAYIERIRIKTPNKDVNVRKLSGGNQQKVVLSKWLAAESKILIMDEPTRGIDVNAKGEIYKLIRDFVENGGGSVILVSSELPEVIGVCQRVIVMRNGEVTADIAEDDLNEETIMSFATVNSSIKE